MRFCPGPLEEAMEQGKWFLADEFNLCPEAVIAALLPVLEGSTSVTNPVTHTPLHVHENFRFFAAQNFAESMTYDDSLKYKILVYDLW